MGCTYSKKPPKQTKDDTRTAREVKPSPSSGTHPTETASLARTRKQNVRSVNFKEELKSISANPFVASGMTAGWDDVGETSCVLLRSEGRVVAKARGEMLRKSVLFARASDNTLVHLGGKMVPMHLEPGEVIITQGDSVHLDDYMYVIESGRVRVTVDAAEQKMYVQKPGSIFGELGPLFGADRNASASALLPTTLLCLPRRAILQSLSALPAAQDALFLRRLTILQGLTDNQILQLTSFVEARHYHHGQPIIRYGTKADDLFIVRRGHVVVTRPGDDQQQVFLARLGEGQLLGQRTVVTGAARTASCCADGEVEVLRIAASHFDRLDNPVLQHVIDCDSVSAVLGRDLTEAQLDRMFDTFKRRHLRPGETLASGPTHSVAIVRRGRLQGDVRETDGYKWCGSLRGDSVEHTVAAEFTVVIVCTLESPAVPDVSYAAFDQARLHTLSTVGSGSIGAVDLVRSDVTNRLYCLKRVHLEREGLPRKLLLNEALIMRQLDSDFCVRLYSVVHHHDQVLLLMQWVPGGELYYHMDKQRCFPEPQARFYAACVAIGLCHMHDKHILHRDLKPENVLMDADGYVLLADFGFAKHSTDDSFNYSMVGTVSYSAPEILSRQGHGAPADLWSFGVLIYEMLCSDTPFAGDDAWDVYRSTLSGRYYLPTHISPAASGLLSLLLQPQPDKRPTISQIKTHTWFADVDWAAMERKQVKPPFLPRLKSPDDTSYFTQF